MINWNDIEEVTSLVEEHEELINSIVRRDHNITLTCRISEIAITNEHILLWYNSAKSDYDTGLVLENIIPIVVMPEVLKRIIEQAETEIIDDNENGFRRGE